MSKVSLIEQMAFYRESTPSFESSQQEYEIEIYLKGYDIDEVRSKSTYNELQEQWGVYVPKTAENAAAGSMRARSTILPGEDEPKYEFAVKIDEGEKGKEEDENDCSAARFLMMKKLADQGLIKNRFKIPSTLENGTHYTLECDAFTNARGELVPWLKIDAEVPEGSELKPTDIPLTYDEIIIVTPGEKADNPELGKKIGALYTEFFRSKNPLVNQD